MLFLVYGNTQILINLDLIPHPKFVDTMIFPILSNNSEIWGMHTKQDFKTCHRSPIEKIHLEFCKPYLEVNNKASNIACRAELGRLPLIISINKRIMKYLVYLNNKDNDSIVKQSFLMSKNLHSINNSFFYSNFMNLIEHYHLPNFDPESLDNDRIRRYTTDMKEKYIFLVTQPGTFKKIRIL